MFPFRAGKRPAGVEMTEAQTEAATQPQYPPPAATQANTTPLPYPVAPPYAATNQSKTTNFGSSPGYPPYASAAQPGPSPDIAVQISGTPEKSSQQAPPQGYAGYPPPAAQQQQAHAPRTPPPAPPPPPVAMISNQYPGGAPEDWSRDIRRGFIRKVLFIVFCQMLLTTGVAVAFYQITAVQRYVTANLWPMLVAWALSLAVILVLACVRRVHRYPYNYMLLLAFTTAFSVLVGCITARYDVEVIAMAFAATAAAVLGAWAVAAFTPFDLTNKGGILISILFGVICVSFIGIFWQNRILYLIIAMVSAVLFTFFLIYDIQKLMGNRQRAYSPDDYIIAALNIYLDIIQIFLNLLQIIGHFAGSGG